MTRPAPVQWDPQQYQRVAEHRLRPLRDLLARIPALPGSPPRIADLGCGAGRPTMLLTERWPDARVHAFDSSPEMLAAAARYAGPTPGGGHVDFAEADIRRWTPEGTYDLILSSAALQWVPGHTACFPAWVDALAPGGVLAFQVPGNHASPSHTLLAEVCDRPRWRDRLAGRLRPIDPPPVLDPADYLTLLTGLGCEVDAWESTYQHVLPGRDGVLEWMKGTGLRPVYTALADDPDALEALLAEYREALRGAYPEGPEGAVVYPFRRVFAVARRLPTGTAAA